MGKSKRIKSARKKQNNKSIPGKKASSAKKNKKAQSLGFGGTTFKPKIWDVLCLSFFVIIWLFPLLYVGLNKEDFPGYRNFLTNNKLYNFSGKGVENKQYRFPPVPNYLTNMHRCACLFTNSVSAWSNYHIEIQPRGSDKWVPQDHSLYAKMNPFGRRTKISRTIGDSRTPLSYGENTRTHKSALRRLESLSKFIRNRYSEVNPDEKPIQAVRYTFTTHQSGSKIAKPEGRWNMDDLLETPVSKRYVSSTHYFDGRKFKKGGRY